MERSQTNEHRQLPPYDLLYDGINLNEAIGNRGVRLIIPRIYLFGRQTPQEYQEKKRKQIEEAFRIEGTDYLYHNPIIVGAVPLKDQLLLAIFDGHHRTRYAGLFNIHAMPSIVCSLDVLVEIINRDKPADKQTDKEKFAVELLLTTAEVVSLLPDSKRPRTIHGISSIDELKTKYVGFNYFGF